MSHIYYLMQLSMLLNVPLYSKGIVQTNVNFVNNSGDLQSEGTILYRWSEPIPRIIGQAIQIRRTEPIQTIVLIHPPRFFYKPFPYPIPLQFPKLRANVIGRGRLISDPTITAGRSIRWCSNCLCGVTFQRDVMVDGIPTNVNEFPWMAALLNNNNFFCTGSLINDRYILTTAHCASRSQRIADITAVFLDITRSNLVQTQTITRRIRRILIHRYFNVGSNFNNDIALFRLDRGIIFDGIITPVCLPPDYKSFVGFTGVTTGWGNPFPNGSVSPLIQETSVPIIPNYECRRAGYGQRITNNMICAGFPNGDGNTCQGDNGGPLHVTNGTYYLLVGIVSWGESCPEVNAPEVYTRVNNYISWIYRNTRDACYC